MHHHEQDVVAEVRRLTDKRGVDVVVEHVGQATWDRSVRSLAAGGRLVTCGNTTGWEAAIDLRFLFSRQLSLLGSYMGTKGELLQAVRFFFDGQLTRAGRCGAAAGRRRRGPSAARAGDVAGKLVLAPVIAAVVPKLCTPAGRLIQESGGMIPLWTASCPLPQSRPSRFRSVSVSLAGAVGVVAAVVAAATIWLMLTDPITVAEAIDTGEVAPLVEELADVIYNAIVGLIKYL